MLETRHDPIDPLLDTILESDAEIAQMQDALRLVQDDSTPAGAAARKALEITAFREPLAVIDRARALRAKWRDPDGDDTAEIEALQAAVDAYEARRPWLKPMAPAEGTASS
jgi:hypothetical protein